MPSPSPSSASETKPINWEAIEAQASFQALLKKKVAFIAPCTVFFLAYYLALPILVGYFPKMMETKVLGEVNVAYLFALSQFFMAWIMAFLYVRAASQWDKAAAAVLAEAKV
jgi:uncharacterized membrane protein (DUF485 family)